MKKIISVLFALCLMLSLMPLTAYADNITEGDWSYSINTVDGKSSAIIKKYTGSQGSVTVPSELGGASVTAIGNNAFDSNRFIESVIIPDTVTEIQSRAFYGCSWLSSVKLGKNLQRIEMYAFAGTRIVNIDLPDSVTYMGESVFSGCTHLTEFKLPPKMTYVPMLLLNNTGITKIKLHEGVTAIFSGAFSMSRVQEVQLPLSMKTIGMDAFQECYSLKRINIPEGATSVGAYCFNKCTALEIITLPSTLRTIDQDAFKGCTSLKNIVIKGSETGMGTTCVGYDTSNQLIPDVIIYCAPGSRAYDWAQDRGITTRDLTGAPYDPATEFPEPDAPIAVEKKANTIKATGKTVNLKAKILKKKDVTVERKKAIAVKGAKGKVTYKKTKGNKKIAVAKNGKITVKKGLKKGTYKVNIKVKAAGNADYKAATKTVTVKIIVK